MTTVIVADSDPSDNGADVVDNCSPPASGQCTVATQADVQPPIVCNGILCYLHNKMDIMVHDTLVKLCADHFTAIDTDTAKQHLYECEEVRKLGLRQGRRRQGPTEQKTTSRIFCLLYTNAPEDYRHLLWLTYQPCRNLILTISISDSYYRNFALCGQKCQS